MPACLTPAKHHCIARRLFFDCILLGSPFYKQGYLDNVSVDDVGRFEEGLLDLVKSQHSGLLADIVSSGTVDEENLNSIISSYSENFESSNENEGVSPEAQEQPDAETAMVDSDVTLPETDIARGEENED